MYLNRGVKCDLNPFLVKIGSNSLLEKVVIVESFFDYFKFVGFDVFH